MVLPAVLAVLLSFLDISPLVKGVAIVQSAMPMAVNGSMLCLEYGGDTETMAQATFITTLAAIITIPVLAPILL
jgi:predicted permease